MAPEQGERRAIRRALEVPRSETARTSCGRGMLVPMPESVVVELQRRRELHREPLVAVIGPGPVVALLAALKSSSTHGIGSDPSTML